jgi:hypothetical protein
VEPVPLDDANLLDEELGKGQYWPLPGVFVKFSRPVLDELGEPAGVVAKYARAYGGAPWRGGAAVESIMCLTPDVGTAGDVHVEVVSGGPGAGRETVVRGACPYSFFGA